MLDFANSACRAEFCDARRAPNALITFCKNFPLRSDSKYGDLQDVLKEMDGPTVRPYHL